MRGPLPLKWLAWGIALSLIALPIVGVLNGWFASQRWPVRKIELRAEYAHVSAEQIRATVETHLAKGFFAVQLADVQKAAEDAAAPPRPRSARAEPRPNNEPGASLGREVVARRRPGRRFGRCA